MSDFIVNPPADSCPTPDPTAGASVTSRVNYDGSLLTTTGLIPGMDMNSVLNQLDIVIGNNTTTITNINTKVDSLEATINNVQASLTALDVADVIDGNSYTNFTGGSDLYGSLQGIDTVLGTLTAAIGGGFHLETDHVDALYETTSKTGWVWKTYASGDFDVTGTTGLTADLAAGKATGKGYTADSAADTVSLTASSDNYVYYDAENDAYVVKVTAIGAGDPAKLDNEVLLYKFETDGSNVVGTVDRRNYAAYNDWNMELNSINADKLVDASITSSKIGALDSILVYSSDLSGSYTNRTVVDKEYVDTAVAGVTAGIWNSAGGGDYYYDAGNIGIGVASPTDTLHVAGTFRYVDGAQAAGRVLVSDANGVAGWADQISLVSVEDEGSLLASNISVLNFIGAGVQATDAGGGTMNVNITGIAAQLNDLTDVTVPSPADGDMFYWDDGAGLWKNTDYIKIQSNSILADHSFHVSTSSGSIFEFESNTAPNAMIMDDTGILTLSTQFKYTFDNAAASPLGAGKVLTSDANGNATWEDPTVASTFWSQNGSSIQLVDLSPTDAMLPGDNDTTDIGSAILRWKDIYVGSTLNYATDIVFSEAGTERGRFLAGGNFGVGVPAPLESIHASGAIILGTTSGTTNGTIRWTGTDFEGRKGGTWVSLATTGDGNGIYDGSDSLSGNTDIANAGFNLGITGTGNFGSGTASPSEKVHVVGNHLVDGTYYIDSASKTLARYDSGNDRIHIGESTSSQINILATGAVNFGGTALVTMANLRSASDTTNVGITLGSASLTYFGDNNLVNGTTHIFDTSITITEATAKIAEWKNNGTSLATLTKDGRWGYGTTAPTAKLHIVGEGTGTVNMLRMQNSAGTLRMIARDDGVFMFNRTSQIFSEQFSFAGRVVISDAGNGRMTTNIEANRVFFDYLNNTNTQLRTGIALAAGEIHSSTAINDSAIIAAQGATNRNLFIGTSSTRVDLAIDTSGYLGLGTTSPSERLHVAGSSRFDGTMRIDATVAGYNVNLYDETDGIAHRFYTATAGNEFHVVHAGVIASPVHVLRSTGISFLGVGSGNVGIGTVAPAEKLHVVGSMRLIGATGSPIAQFRDDSTQTAFEILENRSIEVTTDSAGYFLLQNSSRPKLRIKDTGATTGFKSYQVEHITDELRFQRRSDDFSSLNHEYMRFTGTNLSLQQTSGNVGIGTGAPSEKLHVVGNGKFTNGIGAIGATPSTNSGLRVPTGTTAVSFGNSGGAALYESGNDLRVANRGTSNLLSFFLGANHVANFSQGASPFPTVWTIKAMGATVTLTDRFTQTTFESNYWDGAASQIKNASIEHHTINTSGDSNFQFKIAGSPIATMLDNGNFGIGTASPSETLHVVGNGLIDGDLQVTTAIHAHGFYVQDSNGRVGTNNANPQSQLHIYEPTAADVFIKIGSLTTGVGLTDGLDIGFKQGVSFLMKGHDLADMNWEFGTTGRMTLKHDTGNLGIGTNTPAAKLHVITGSGTNGFRVDNASGSFVLHVDDNNPHVGINTTSALHPLDVRSTDGVGIHIAAANAGTNITNVAGLLINNSNTTNGNYAGIGFGNGVNAAGDAIIGVKMDRSGNAASMRFGTANGAGVVEHVQLNAEGVWIFKSFAVASLPTAVAGGVIRISDETGGDTIAYSDGTNWRRVSDGAIAS